MLVHTSCSCAFCPVHLRLQRRLEEGGYSHPKEFKHDVNLVWNNCMTYNAVS